MTNILYTGYIFRYSIRWLFQLMLGILFLLLTHGGIARTTNFEQKIRELLLTKSQVKLGKNVTTHATI